MGPKHDSSAHDGEDYDDDDDYDDGGGAGDGDGNDGEGSEQEEEEGGGSAEALGEGFYEVETVRKKRIRKVGLSPFTRAEIKYFSFLS